MRRVICLYVREEILVVLLFGIGMKLYCIKNALHRLRFHDSVSPKFVLFYLMYLKDIGEIDNKYSKGVTIKHLVKKALLSIPLPIPPKLPSYPLFPNLIS